MKRNNVNETRKENVNINVSKSLDILKNPETQTKI